MDRAGRGHGSLHTCLNIEKSVIGEFLVSYECYMRRCVMNKDTMIIYDDVDTWDEVEGQCSAFQLTADNTYDDVDIEVEWDDYDDFILHLPEGYVLALIIESNTYYEQEQGQVPETQVII